MRRPRAGQLLYGCRVKSPLQSVLLMHSPVNPSGCDTQGVSRQAMSATASPARVAPLASSLGSAASAAQTKATPPPAKTSTADARRSARSAEQVRQRSFGHVLAGVGAEVLHEKGLVNPEYTKTFCSPYRGSCRASPDSLWMTTTEALHHAVLHRWHRHGAARLAQVCGDMEPMGAWQA